MSGSMTDQRAAVARVERETGLILTEAFACAAQLPEAVRDTALARLKERRAAFQQSIDALYDLLRQAGPPVAPHMQPEGASVSIMVNGLSGPRCTVEASTEWTVRQVHQAIFERIDVPVEWQKLLKGTEKLLSEATVSSLISAEHVETLELTLVVEPSRPVSFVGMSNGLEQVEPGHLRKTGGAYEWDAGAVSTESFEVGQGRGLRFRPGTTDMSFLIGLGSRSTAPANCREIEYAAYCAPASGQFHVYESGERTLDTRLDGGTSPVELRVTEAEVEFLVDGVLKHTSQLRGQQRLYALASFYTVGGEALDIQWL